MNSLHKSLIAAGLLATLGLGAVAQTSPAPATVAPARSEAQAHRGPGVDRAQFQQRREQRMAQRLARFKQKLAITPAQEGAWTQWTSALKPQQRLQRPNRIELARMNTPERIDRMRALRAERMARMDQRADATKAFYGALSAEQKKVFDESGVGLRGFGGGKRGGHHGHRGHRG